MRLFRLLVAAACAAGTLALPAVSAGPAVAATAPPQTVPALRQWTAGTGSYTFSPTGRIVVDPGVRHSTRR